MRSATDPPGETADVEDDAPDRWCRYCGDKVTGERCENCDGTLLGRMVAMATEKRRGGGYG